MTNPLITADEARHGALISEQDGVEYREIALIYKLNGANDAQFYCRADLWPSSDAGRVASLHAEIARLKEKLVDLDAAYLARLSELHTKIATLEGIPAELAAAPVAPALPHDDYPYCPECHDGPFTARKGWKAHRRIKHGVTDHAR